MKILSDGSDVPKLVGIEHYSWNGTDKENEDNGKEDQLFHSAAKAKTLALAGAGDPTLTLNH